MAEEEKNIALEGVDLADLAGINDRNIDLIREKFKSTITLRGERLHLKGESEELAQLETIFKELMFLQKRQSKITEGDVNLIIELVTGSQDNDLEKRTGIKREDLDEVILVDKNDFIKPKTLGQREFYLQTQKNEIVFVIGPAGTGKTYLSVAIALAALRSKKSAALFSRAPRLKRARASASCPAIYPRRLTPISSRCLMRLKIWCRAKSSAATSRRT